MANPNTTEEPKKPLQKPDEYVPTPYAPPTPTAAYENNPIYDEIQRQINEWATKTDPQAQAEQDARIQRGRNFWTGANLFANVIANAINASGTAKGAPSMTINDAASQKMYDTWRDADKELKADRRAAQQRLDALRLQDAQFRMAEVQARDKAALDAYNMNFKLQNEAAKAKNDREWDEYNAGIKRQQALEDEERGNKEWRDRWDYQGKHPHRTGTGGTSKKTTGERSTKYDTKAGSVTMTADSSREQNYRIYSMSDTMYKYIDGMDAKEKEALFGKDWMMMAKPTDIMGRRKFFEDNFQKLYDSDSEFRTMIDAYYGDYLAFDEPESNVDDRKYTTAPPKTSAEAFPKSGGFGSMKGQAEANKSAEKIKQEVDSDFN